MNLLLTMQSSPGGGVVLDVCYITAGDMVRTPSQSPLTRPRFDLGRTIETRDYAMTVSGNETEVNSMAEIITSGHRLHHISWLIDDLSAWTSEPVNIGPEQSDRLDLVSLSRLLVRKRLSWIVPLKGCGRLVAQQSPNLLDTRRLGVCVFRDHARGSRACPSIRLC